MTLSLLYPLHEGATLQKEGLTSLTDPMSEDPVYQQNDMQNPMPNGTHEQLGFMGFK